MQGKTTKYEYILATLKILCIAIPIFLCGILVFVNIMQYYASREMLNMLVMQASQQGSSAGQLWEQGNGIVTTDLLNTGITIISIAVTIWIGLNIYNVVSKEEIEKRMKEYDGYRKEIDQYMDEYRKSMTKVYMTNQLYRTSDRYIASEFFMDQFEKSIDIFEGKVLIAAERRYISCCNNYEYGRWSEARKMAEQLLVEYNNLYLKYMDAGEVSLDDAQKNFLLMRKADMLFYKNTSASHLPDGFSCEEMEESAALFAGVLENMAVKMKDNKALKGYFYNSMGYTPDLVRTHVEDQERRGSAAEKSLEYMKKAVQYRPDNGRYHRNLGLAYEHAGRYDDAKKEYQEAVHCDKEDCKAYISLGALELKQIDQKLKLYERTEEGSKRFLMDISGNELKEYKKNIEQSILNSKIAMSMQFGFEDSHYNIAKAYMYQYLLSDKSEKQWFTQAKEELDIALSLNASSRGALFCLRNLYEAEGDIEKALEVSNMSAIKEVGDNPKMKKAYEEQI